MQCDHIGRFLKVFGDKFSYNNSPNISKRFELFKKCHYLNIIWCGYILGNVWENLATFHSFIWSHWMDARLIGKQFQWHVKLFFRWNEFKFLAFYRRLQTAFYRMLQMAVYRMLHTAFYRMLQMTFYKMLQMSFVAIYRMLQTTFYKMLIMAFSAFYRMLQMAFFDSWSFGATLINLLHE